MTKIFHAEISGTRESKYEWLESHDISSTKWKKLNPKSEFYLFIPQNEKGLKDYQSFYKVTDIFPVNSVGIVTARDELTIHFTKDSLWNTVRNFSNLDVELAREAYNLGKDARDWKVELAQKDLKDSGPGKNNVIPILYRPFDVRYTYFTGRSRGFQCMPRNEVMKNMLKENICLISIRRSRSKKQWNYGLVSNSSVSGSTAVSSLDINYCFPLFLYTQPKNKKSKYISQLMMFEPAAVYQAKQPNIKPELFDELKAKYKKEVTPEEIFYYIYAVLYSNIYRTKYAEFLKMDFPRVPFTADYKIFIKLGKLGSQLADLHLLKSKQLEKPIAKFPVEGSNKVEKLNYDSLETVAQSNNLYINKEQYFKGIPPEVWQYQIGGYQVCDKWLKDRKGRTLSLEEITTYCKIVTALSKTIELQKEIDDLYKLIGE